MRGIPSCGKSHRAKELANGDESIICSADSFLADNLEEYRNAWLGADEVQLYIKLDKAHLNCKNKAKELLKNKSPLVIIDNTNLKIKDIIPYFELALEYGYEFNIEEPTSSWWVNDIKPYLKKRKDNKTHLLKMCDFLFEQNKLTHGVELETFNKLIFNYEFVTIDSIKSYINRLKSNSNKN